MSEFYEQPLPIRTYDIDFAGIVSNIVFIRWLEDLRLALLERLLNHMKLLKTTGLTAVLFDQRADGLAE